jgi:hypothetical protein
MCLKMALATDIDVFKYGVSYRYRCLKMASATDIDVSKYGVSYRYRYV